MNKKFYILILISILALKSAHSQLQIFGAANAFETNQFVLGANPFTMISNGDNPENHFYIASNIYGSKGITDNFNARLRFGIFSDTYDDMPENYSPVTFYGGLEFEALLLKGVIKKDGPAYGVSLLFGGHAWGNKTGADAALNLTYRIVSDFYVYSGIDADYNYEEVSRINSVVTKDFVLHTWVPAGVQVRSTDELEFIMEIDIPLSKTDNFVIGCGVNYYIQTKKRR